MVTGEVTKMRIKTLNALCLVFAFGTVLALQQFSVSNGVKIPFLARPVAAHVLVLILMPIIYIPLYAFNRHILKWRLERGRDILEEEKYESESGFISLKPKQPDSEHNGGPTASF
jgi:hypothetical protein